MRTKSLKKKLLEKPKKVKRTFISSGSTLLNLAVTGTPDGCFSTGVYSNITGDSDTGKSVLAKTILAEAALDDRFEDCELIYINAERANLLTLPVLEERMEEVRFNSPEEMYYDVVDRMKKGKRIIAVCDSMDALIAKSDEKAFDKRKQAAKSGGKETAGAQGAKARVNSANLNRVTSLLETTDSAFIIVSQTRDNINMGGMPMFGGEKKIRSGGRALKFYNRCEIWLSHNSMLKKTYKSKKVQVGSISTAVIKKNHINGRQRSVPFIVYNDFGIDDIGSCIKFLKDWEHWKGSKVKVKAPEFDFNGNDDDLIRYIEKKEKRIQKFKKIVVKVWEKIEDHVAIKRKSRYKV